MENINDDWKYAFKSKTEIVMKSTSEHDLVVIIDVLSPSVSAEKKRIHNYMNNKVTK